MAQSIDGARAQLQVLAGALSGVRAAPNRIPDNISQWPFAVTFLRELNVVRPNGAFTIWLCKYVTEIHISRQDLGRGIEAAQPYMISFPIAVLADVTLAGSCATVNGVTGALGPMQWGGVDTFGARFEIDLKITGT